MNKLKRGFLKFPGTFIKALTSFKYYRTLNKLPLSQAILYIVTISFLFAIVAVIPTSLAISSSMKEFRMVYDAKAPDFRITDGILTTGTGKPVFMIDDAGKNLIVVFDETDSVSESDFREYQSVLLLDSDSVFMKTPFSNQDMPYSTIFQSNMDKEQFAGYLSLITLSNVLFVFLYIIIFILFNMIGALFIASIGNFMLMFKKTSLRLNQSYKIACYASTLPILLKTLRHLLGFNIQYFDLIYILLGILYFWNGINTILPASKKPKESG